MPAGTAGLTSIIEVKVNGTLLTEAIMNHLAESRVSQTVGAASHLSLRFHDPEFDFIDGDFFDIGKPIVVLQTDSGGAAKSVFSGEIVAIGVDQAGHLMHELVVEALDKSHRLSRISQIRTFTQMSYSDIVSKIAAEAGLTAQVTATSTVHEYVMQAGTDWALLDEISARTGMEWLVDGENLILRPVSGTDAVTVTFGEELRKFRARYSASAHVDTVSVRSWDPLTKAAVVGEDKSSSATPPGASAPDGLAALRTKAKKITGKVGSLTTASLTTGTQAEAAGVAKAIATRNSRHEFTARGEMWLSAAVRAGGKIKVEGVGTKMKGQYYLTTVEHIFGRSNSATKFTAGGPAGEALVDTIGRSSPSIGQFAGNGFVIGIVTNIKDPKNLNRVKVKFPALSDDNESNWARLVTPMSGNAAGLVMMPALNDEVLVAFEHSDFRRPYVLGSLYNGKDKPPYPVTDGKFEKHGFKTVAKHELIFDDTDGKETISIIHGKKADTKVVLAAEKVQVWVMGDKMVEIKAGGATIVLNEGNITMSGKAIEIKASQDLKLSGLNVEIKANSGLKMEGSATAELKAGASVKVEASGQLALKGAMTMIN